MIDVYLVFKLTDATTGAEPVARIVSSGGALRIHSGAVLLLLTGSRRACSEAHGWLGCDDSSGESAPSARAQVRPQQEWIPTHSDQRMRASQQAGRALQTGVLGGWRHGTRSLLRCRVVAIVVA